MSLDLTLYETRRAGVFSTNITHNLAAMAKEAGVYWVLWRPDELPWVRTAEDMIPALEVGLKDLVSRPDHFRQFTPSNGWGTYDTLVASVEDVLRACREHPSATPHACR